MTMPATDTSVRESILVDAPVERAFSVFTEGIASWWPPEHHILQTELAEMVFEPRVGGHVYDPPNRVVFSWDINTQWQIETDLSKTSEIEVRFIADSRTRTRVELEHRNLDRHGDGWEEMRSAVGSPEGWRIGLERFGDVVRAA